MSKIKTTNYTADKLWKVIDDLDKLEDQEDVLRTFASSSDLVFKHDDKSEEPLSVFCGRFYVDNGRFITKDELKTALINIANVKEEFKTKLSAKDKEKANSAGAGFGFKGERNELMLRTELIRTNKNDFDLFSEMRQCGSSLVLKKGDQVLLCVEDGKGHVKIGSEKFLKGSIAREVKETFEIKAKYYVKMMNDFVQNLDDYEEEDGHAISPVEDFLSTEVPASMSKMYQLVDYSEVHKEGTSKNAREFTVHHYRWELKKKIEHFDDLFDWVLDNWRKFNKCIHGEDHFYAWSNDRNRTAASYWDLPTGEVKCPQSWKNFLQEKMSTHLMMRLVCYLGMMCDASNRCQQYLIISGTGGEGKDYFERLITNVMPRNSVSNLDTSALANDDRFGLANREIWKSHLSIIHELNSAKNLQSEKAKQYFAQNSMDLEVKNAGVVSWEPINHKTIVNSNTKISIKEYANRRRAVPITFINKLKWSQELEDQMQKDAKQFLDFCYCFYKKCPLVKEGQYLVLCEEDEKAYLDGTLNMDKEGFDRLSKRAFTEECLKDYYNTDEYTEDDIVYDIFEPLIQQAFVLTGNEEDTLCNSAFKSAFIKAVANNDEFCAAFEVRRDPNDPDKLLNFYPFKNTNFWKFTKYLKDKYGLECKVLRESDSRIRSWRGIRISTDLDVKKVGDGIDDLLTDNKPKYDEDKYNNCI